MRIYSFYHDDADYGWRLKLLGYRCACIVSTKAYHIVGATLGLGNPRSIYLIVRNNIWITAKNSSLAWFLLRFLLMLIEVLVSYFGHMLLIKKNGKAALLTLRGILDGLINLRVAFNKKANIMKFRKVKEKAINMLMNPLIDAYLIFPRKLRKAFGLKQ